MTTQHTPTPYPKLRATPDMDTRDCEYHNAILDELVAALRQANDLIEVLAPACVDRVYTTDSDGERIPVFSGLARAALAKVAK